MKFRLQNSYQDSGWEDTGEAMDTLREARRRARKMSANPIAFGNVRILDASGTVVAEYSCGEARR